jgi:Peptidase A4 family
MSVHLGRTGRCESARADEDESRRALAGAIAPVRSRRRHLITLAAGIGLATAVGCAFALPAGAIGREDVPPQFVSIHTRALDLSWRGESVLVRAQVENSTSCRLVLARRDEIRAHYSRRWRSCASGRFTERIRFGPDFAASAHVAQLQLIAKNRFGGVVVHNLRIHLHVHHPTKRSSSRPSKSVTGSSTTDTSTNVVASTTSAQSASWAGYVSTLDSPATAVSATWTVPSVSCGSDTSWLGAWLGVDGAESSGPGTSLLFQDGIYSYCINGQQQNEAWWESYPGPANALGSVNTGDTISASLWQASGGWMWSVTDETTGASYRSTQPVNYSGPAGTAEWIVEDPGAPTEPFVDGFSPITFTNMTMTTANGSSFTNGSTWQMVQNGHTLATPDQTAAAVASNHSLTVRFGD